MSDHEIFGRAMRITGQLEALKAMAENSAVMPNDLATNAFLEVIRQLTNKAYLSAFRYAEEIKPRTSTTDKPSGSQT